MPWECLKCGGVWEDIKQSCETCNIGKEFAINMEIKKKTWCPSCFHPHVKKTFCHVFVEVDEFEEEEEDEASVGTFCSLPPSFLPSLFSFLLSPFSSLLFSLYFFSIFLPLRVKTEPRRLTHLHPLLTPIRTF